MVLTETGLAKVFQRVKSFVASQLNSKASAIHTHSISDITDLETWNYDSNSDSIIVSGGTDTWSYDSQSNAIIVS